MTQRIFDVENEKDMADLWDILPDNIDTIRKINRWDIAFSAKGNGEFRISSRFIRIEWHDKTKITRPTPEATEADIGKLCYFWEKDFDKHFVGLLGFRDNTSDNKKYQMLGGFWWSHARCLTKQEIEELC